jgi:hypothetical protein
MRIAVMPGRGFLLFQDVFPKKQGRTTFGFIAAFRFGEGLLFSPRPPLYIKVLNCIILYGF